jgi:hypothetical protein
MWCNLNSIFTCDNWKVMIWKGKYGKALAWKCQGGLPSKRWSLMELKATQPKLALIYYCQ